ncbi:MAG: prepilin-type N-terminal cleavage/methylation domain-containing protein [Myxococcota bacterium]|jgi:prepilin-type N-terminal cleavage/methylation domain-containing protein|nr:prepilin-type N-terminal cleavage/methylation domain-containing protein [Myxococcota bacterium]
MRTQANKTYGFTLFELSLVVAIVSILAITTLFAQGYIKATNLTKAYQSIERLKVAAGQYAAGRGEAAFTVSSPNLLPTIFERGFLTRRGATETIKIGPGLEITALLMTTRLDNQKIIAIALGPIHGLGPAAAGAEPLPEGLGREIVFNFFKGDDFVNGGPIASEGAGGFIEHVCNRRNSGRNVKSIILCFVPQN